MQANQKNVIWSVAIVGIILLIVMLFGFSNINVPSASEIADEIVIEFPEFPEYPEYETLDNSKLDELWQVLFGGRISDLRDYVYIEEGDERELTNEFLEELIDELDWDEVEEYVEDELENFDKFDGSFLNIDDYELEEVGFEIVEVGEYEYGDVIYNEGEDSEVIVTLEYDFRYEKDDTDKDYKDTLYITITAGYEGSDLEDFKVEYSL